MGMHMGTNKHAAERVKSDHTTPPPGPDRMTDQDHAMKAGAMKAGKRGTSQRKSEVRKESPTRDEGRDDHRTGSDHRRH